MPVISILVAVYNSSLYLDRCIQSVVAQKPENCELLLVNDGSTDISGSMCDAWAARYSWVRTVHKLNGGLADARNAGLRAAKGEYALFLDGDDALAPGSLAQIQLLLRERSPEVLLGQYSTIRERDGAVLLERDTHLDPAKINGQPTDCVVTEVRRVRAAPATWRHVVSLPFLRRHGLYFEKGLMVEDALWTPRLLCNAERFWLNETSFYYYHIRDGSIMTAASHQKIENICFIVQRNHAFAAARTEAQQAYINHLNFLVICTLFRQLRRAGAHEKTYVYNWLRENSAAVRDALREYVPAHVLSQLMGSQNALSLMALALDGKEVAATLRRRKD